VGERCHVVARDGALERQGLAGRQVKEVAGVQRIVAQELEESAVKLVAPGARRQVYDTA